MFSPLLQGPGFSLAERQTALLVAGTILVRTTSDGKIYSQALLCEAIHEDTYYSYVSIKKTCFFLWLLYMG